MDPKRFKYKYKYVPRRHTKGTAQEAESPATEAQEAVTGAAKGDRGQRERLTAMLTEDIKDFLDTNSSLFFNERDIQVTLALHLTDSKRYDSVDMEYALPMEELEARVEGFGTAMFPWLNSMSVDIVVEKDGLFVPIELKYATRPVDKEILRFGEKMLTDALIIKDQAASNLTMYNYWKDVRRLEMLDRHFRNVAGGIALLITNNPTFWNRPQADSGYVMFATTEGRVMDAGLKEWGARTAKNITETHPNFHLSGTYTCRWKDTSIDALSAKGRVKTPFRYLLTETGDNGGRQ